MERNKKHQYEKPITTVVLLESKGQLLQASVPLIPEFTNDQW